MIEDHDHTELSEHEKKMREDLDAKFKRLITDKYILSTILMGCVQECKNMSLEETIKCLDIDEECDRVKGRNTEFISKENNRAIKDSLFEVRLPDNNRLGILVNIEAQGKYYDSKTILNRAAYYTSGLIVEQNGKDFPNNEFAKMKKVYSIWCMMNPPMKKRNSVKEYHMESMDLRPASSKEEVRWDPVSIVMVNMDMEDPKDRVYPNSDETESRVDMVIDMLNTLFTKEVDFNEKVRRFEQDYKLPVSDELSETIADIMTLTYEDFVEGRIESARESGIYIGEVRAYASTVSNLVLEMGISIDEALKILHIPTEYHDIIKESLAQNN